MLYALLAGVLIGILGTLAFITIWYIPPCGDDHYHEVVGDALGQESVAVVVDGELFFVE